MKKIPLYKFYFVAADFFIFALSFVFTAYITWNNGEIDSAFFMRPFYHIIILYFIISIILSLTFQYNGLYKINIILMKPSHLTQIIKSVFYGILTILLFSFLFKYLEILYSRIVLFTFSIVLLSLLYIMRVEILRALYLKIINKQFKRRVLIVGAGKAAKLLATKFILEDSIGMHIVGFIDDHRQIDDEIVAGKKVLGSMGNLSNIIETHNVDEILVVMDNVNYDRLLEITDICKQFEVGVRITSELFDIISKKVTTEKYDEYPIVDVTQRINSKVNLLFKRIFDIILASLGLIILSPLFLTISIAVKLTSSGPIFFYQDRIGRQGKPFKFFKFRSMYVNNSEDEERKSMMLDFIKNGDENGKKIINKSRITSIGKVIRKTSLDELPQLFNVIIGDMSLVGPRPCLPYEYQNYSNWQKRRVEVLPGCTGIWQVTGRSSVSFKDSIVLDLYYINNMSPWMDLQILFKTIPVILFAKGGE
jgi:exopolysaccharide biosynthesis polyprenyl glycosylphosphotransferase